MNTNKKQITITEALTKATVSPLQFHILTGLSMPSIYRALESKNLVSTRINGRILISTQVLKDMMGGEV